MFESLCIDNVNGRETSNDYGIGQRRINTDDNSECGRNNYH